MKFIGLAGSPRKHGNTESLLDAFLEGAKAGGGQVQKVRLMGANIHPCVGCEQCFKKGECQFDDDASALYEPLCRADVVVLATPVYFYSPSTYAKLLMDRCQALWARKYILKQADCARSGRGVLISTGGSKGKNLFEGMQLAAKYFMDAFGKKLVLCLTFSNVDQKKAILDHPTAMEQARTMGRRFAEDPDFNPPKEC